MYVCVCVRHGMAAVQRNSQEEFRFLFKEMCKYWKRENITIPFGWLVAVRHCTMCAQYRPRYFHLAKTQHSPEACVSGVEWIVYHLFIDFAQNFKPSSTEATQDFTILISAHV